MAELLLKIENGSGYEAGDIICAFSRMAIQWTHSTLLCRADAPFTRDGLRRDNTLYWHLSENTYDYKMQRVSKTEVLQTEIATGDTILVGPEANANGHHMDVEHYLQRRLEYPRHRIFGTPGAEYWYAKERPTPSKVLSLWNKIETFSPHREADHRDWPLTPKEKRHFLGIGTVDMTPQEAANLVAAVETDEERPVRLKKRANFVDIDTLVSGKTGTDVRNPSKEVDIRHIKNALNIVAAK